MRKKTVLGSLVIFALVLVFACTVAVRVPRGGHEGLAPEKAVAADTRPARRGGPAGEGNPQDGEISARDTGPGSEDASRAESVGATGLGDDGAAPAGGEEQDEFEQDSGKELGEPDHTWGGQGTALAGSEVPEAARTDSRSVVLAGASEADAGEEVGAQTVGEPAAGGPAEGRDGDVDESSVQSGEEGPEDGGEESVDLSVAGSEEDEQVFELPEGAAYEPEEVLLSVDSGASAEDVEALLAKVPGIAAQPVDAADVSSGLLCVELEPGASVEDAINAVRAARSPVVRGSQPNYVYYLAGADEDVAAADAATADVAPDAEIIAAEEADAAESETPSAPDEETPGLNEAPIDEEAPGQNEAPINEEAPGQNEVAPSENDTLTDVEEEPLVPGEGEGVVDRAPSPDQGEGEDEDAADDAPDKLEDADAAEAAMSKGNRSVDTLNTESVVLETHESSATSSSRNATAGDRSVPNARVTIDDPKADKLWGLESMRADEAWSLARCEGRVSVAVVDNGFALDHEDLAQNFIAGSAYDAYAAYEGRLDDVGSPPDKYHGTHVAGIVAAAANNGTGVAGISYNARIVPINCFDDSGYSNSFLLALSYDYIIENAETYNIKVVNMSLGSAEDSDSFEDDVLLAKVRKAHEKGIVTVASAGNEIAHTDDDGFRVKDAAPPFYKHPGDSASVVGVIALEGIASDAGNDASGAYEVRRAEWSNYNVLGQGGANTRKGKNISAPGEDILSTVSAYVGSTGYYALGGTSMASPYVAGVVALEFAANPGLSADEAVDILCHSAHDLGAQGWDEEYGFGEADAYEAVRMAAAGGVTAGAGEAGEVVLRLVVPEGGYSYDGTAREPDVEATLVGPEGGSVPLVRDRDFAVAYADNVDAGWATATVTGAGDYEGAFRRDLHFTIRERQGRRRHISSEGIEVEIAGSYTFEARPLCPSNTYENNVTVTDGGRLLEPEYDYRVLGYEDNVDAGEGVVVIEGAGAYEGVRRERFAIARCPIDDESNSYVYGNGVYTYTGEPIQPDMQLSRCFPNGARVGGMVAYDLDLVEGVDYTLTCVNNVNVGTATATFTGIGNYTGTITQSFDIYPASIDSAVIKDIPDQAYTGKSIKPEPTVTVDGRILKKGIDYLLYYADNIEEGVATVFVCGINGYEGTTRATFQIVPAGIAKAKVSAIAAKPYTGKAIKPKPRVTLGGRTLKVGRDYTLSYAKNTKPGTATIVVSGINGYEGTTRATFQIVPASIAKAKVSAIAAKPYTGKVIKPKPRVTLGGRTLKVGRDYTLSYAKNTKPGTATVSVKGKGNYKGTRKVKFRIVQPTVSYRVHVQGVGNLTAVRNGQLAGTTGQSRRLEAVWMGLGKGFPVPGGIRYKSHVQGSGWERGWAKDGKRSGTTGKSRRLEAVRIELTGQMAKRYDVWYRVHAQGLGWMGWAKNGAKAGTTGQSRRLEAIQVVLVPKGQNAPGATYRGARQTFTKAFVS